MQVDPVEGHEERRTEHRAHDDRDKRKASSFAVPNPFLRRLARNRLQLVHAARPVLASELGRRGNCVLSASR